MDNKEISFGNSSECIINCMLHVSFFSEVNIAIQIVNF